MFSAEREVSFARICPEDAVYTVDNIDPHHGYFVDNNQFNLVEKLSLSFIVLEKFKYSSRRKVGIVGENRSERESEKRMEG